MLLGSDRAALQFVETPPEIRASAQQDDLLFFVPMSYDPVSHRARASGLVASPAKQAACSHQCIAVRRRAGSRS